MSEVASVKTLGVSVGRKSACLKQSEIVCCCTISQACCINLMASNTEIINSFFSLIALICRKMTPFTVVGLEVLNHRLVHRLGLACCVRWKEDKLNALQS